MFFDEVTFKPNEDSTLDEPYFMDSNVKYYDECSISIQNIEIDTLKAFEIFDDPQGGFAPTTSAAALRHSNSPDLFEEADKEKEEEETSQLRSSPDVFADLPNEDDEAEKWTKLHKAPKYIFQPLVCQCEVLHFRCSKEILARIEFLILHLLREFVNTGNAKFTVCNTCRWDNFFIENGILSLNNSSKLTYREIVCQSGRSKFHFALMMRVLAEVYLMSLAETTCTSRELFYKNLELAGNQTNMESAIKDVCRVLNIAPWELGILSSAKGLIAGSLCIFMTQNNFIDCSNYEGPTLLPHDFTNIRLLETNAKFVLIVEKDTVFERFLNQNILTNLGVEIILITGKGFPDIGTRLMVNRLWLDFNLPIYLLVDADPFGIEIMFVYRYGSKAMAQNASKLACPHIRWIGIHPSELEMLAIPTIPQTAKDRKKVNELLDRTYVTSEIRRELEVLKKIERKAEIESISAFSFNFLINDYIPNKIRRNLII